MILLESRSSIARESIKINGIPNGIHYEHQNSYSKNGVFLICQSSCYYREDPIVIGLKECGTDFNFTFGRTLNF